MAPNGLEIATNTASVVINEAFKTIALYLGPKYLHLPEANQGMKEKSSKFKTKFGEIQAFECIDGTHIPIVCPSHDVCTLSRLFLLQTIPFTYRRSCIRLRRLFLWMLNISGLVVFKTQRFK